MFGKGVFLEEGLEGGSPLPPRIFENRNFAALAASQE